MANTLATMLVPEILQIGSLTLPSGSILDVTFLGPHKSAIDFYYTITTEDGQPSQEGQALPSAASTTTTAERTLVTQAGSASGLPAGFNGLQQLGQLGEPPSQGNLAGAVALQAGPLGIVTFFAKSIKDGKGVELTIENSQTDPDTFTLTSTKFSASAKVLPPPQPSIFTTDVTIGSDSLVGLRFESAGSGPASSTRTVTITGELFREAAFDNVVGLYMANRSTGDVVDPLTGLPVKKGAWSGPVTDYRQAVVNHDVWSDSIADLTTGMVAASFDVGAAVDLADYVLLPYLLVNGSSPTATEAEKAFFLGGTSKNDDGLVHTRLMGLNTLGFEDLSSTGDFDFDDNILSITSLAVSSPPGPLPV
jgi:hypothetical protein